MKKGFTLTELLAVIAILAILSIAAISGFNAMGNNSKKKTLENKISSIELAAEKFAHDKNLNESTIISTNRLVVEGYLQPDKSSEDGLAEIINPVTGDNMICNLVRIDLNKDNINVTFYDNKKDCSLSQKELEDSEITVRAYKFINGSNREIDYNAETKTFDWTKEDVLLYLTFENEKNIYSVSYEYGGEMIEKIATTKAPTASAPADKEKIKNYYNELLIENVGILFNYKINILVYMQDGSVKTKEVTVRIDKEKPIGYTNISNDTTAFSEKEAKIFHDDGAGSGIYSVHYRNELEEYGHTVSLDNKEIKDGNDIKAKFDLAGTLLKLKTGTYHIKITDKVGNESDDIIIDANNFNTTDLSCDLNIYPLNNFNVSRISSSFNWYNQKVSLRLEAKNLTGDNGAVYNLIEGNDIGDSNLTRNANKNERILYPIHLENEQAIKRYTGGIKGIINNSSNFKKCNNDIGLDFTAPEIKNIEYTENETYKKRHTIIITFSDNLSGFYNESTSLGVKFNYVWSTNNTTTPSKFKTAYATLSADKKEATYTLTDNTDIDDKKMTGTYYLWIGSELRDKAGNRLVTFASSYKFLFDNTPPTCTESGDSTDWTKDDRILYYGCSDVHSKCANGYSGGSETINTTTQTYDMPSYSIKDKAGNVTVCDEKTRDAYVDKTNPTCEFSVSGTKKEDKDEYLSDVTVTMTTADDDSQVKEFGIGTTYNSESSKTLSTNGTQTYNGLVKDNALNTGTCDITVKKNTGLTVTYDSNGGNACKPKTKSVTYNEAYGDLCSPTRTGHTFGNWYSAKTNGTVITKDTTVTAKEDHTIYASWSANSYTVTYDTNGGTACSPTTKSVTYGEEYGTLCSTTKNGFEFNGWWTGDDDGTKVEATTKVTATSNHTLYAHWTATSTCPAKKLVIVIDNSSSTSSYSKAKKKAEKIAKDLKVGEVVVKKYKEGVETYTKGLYVDADIYVYIGDFEFGVHSGTATKARKAFKDAKDRGNIIYCIGVGKAAEGRDGCDTNMEELCDYYIDDFKACE